MSHAVQGRRGRGGIVLAALLAIFKPGGQIMPITLLLAPHPGFSDLPTALHSAHVLVNHHHTLIWLKVST